MNRVVCTDPLFLLFWQEVLGEEGSQPQDNSELIALKERVKTLSSEKAAHHEKMKKLCKAKKGQSLAYMMQSIGLFCLVFISFSFNRVHSLLKIVKD